MAIESDYDLTDSERQELFNKSPLLSRLLDPDIDLDPEEWVKMLESESTAIQDEMTKDLDPRYFQLGLVPIAIFTNTLNVFPDDSEEAANIGAVEVFIGIGYQLESGENCAMALNEILVRLIETAIIKIPEDESESKEIGAAVYSCLLAGAYWKSIVTGKNPDEDTPQIFDDFFKGKLDDF